MVDQGHLVYDVNVLRCYDGILFDVTKKGDLVFQIGRQESFGPAQKNIRLNTDTP